METTDTWKVYTSGILFSEICIGCLQGGLEADRLKKAFLLVSDRVRLVAAIVIVTGISASILLACKN